MKAVGTDDDGKPDTCNMFKCVIKCFGRGAYCIDGKCKCGPWQSPTINKPARKDVVGTREIPATKLN
ncbi:unnamed protein product [Ilex paraguariensis]|uniref:Uncharacterized protein n=1 Tax=Ilex paraguariensis TaxID=185542 RepID=A0ABC8UGV4_9AQUA